MRPVRSAVGKMKVQVFGTLVFFYFSAALALEDLGRYHNNLELNKVLKSLATRHPNLTHLYSIGKSVNGTELQVIRLGGLLPVGTPHVKLIGNIHGNEPVGRELLIRLAEFLLSNYGIDDLATRILNTTYIHILPSMNPDGFAVSQEGTCTLGPGRRNDNKVDLNRNFPSSMYPEDVNTPVQPETRAIMQWMHSVPFVLSAALHGGSLVANYPYDVAASKKTLDLHQLMQEPGGIDSLLAMMANDSFKLETRMRIEHMTEDNELFRRIAANYSSTHGQMAGETCPEDYTQFPEGITNGAAWYPITGSMQDYNYDFHGCMEITLELSCCKYPGSHELERYWNQNKMPLLNFIQQSHLGVKGVVRNGSTPIAKAAVSVMGRKTSQLTSDQGEYWKLLSPGTYWIQVVKDGFKTAPQRVMIPDSTSDHPVVVNIDFSVIGEENQLPAISESIGTDTDGDDLPVSSYNWPETNWTFEGDDGEQEKIWTLEEGLGELNTGDTLSGCTLVVLVPTMMALLLQ